MSLWKWIKAYFKGFTVLVATPEKHYRIVWFKGYMKMTTEIPEIRGIQLDAVWFDEENR